MQSEDDATRINKMGASWEKIVVTGNIKFDVNLAAGRGDQTRSQTLEEAMGLTGQTPPLIVAGSTHPDEEQILIEALRKIRSAPGLEQTRLLVAPRHPERFEAVEQLIVRSGLRVHRRTTGAGSTRNAEVILLDTVGELAAVYRFATIAFVGGSLIRHGGHSIMEPALYSKPIVIGPSMENFRSIVEEFRAHNAITQLRAGEDDKNLQVQQLTEILIRLLRDSEQREAMGAAAHAILESNRGAAQRTFQRIAAVFESKTGDAPLL
jgi:3-deoxy-D-manno-octulosonic-acid transferase